jgi:hypothetical protein
MIWDNPQEQQILASPVSCKGVDFLNSLTGKNGIAIAHIDSPVDEFMSHVPPDLKVVFNRDDGNLIVMNSIRGLQ